MLANWIVPGRRAVVTSPASGWSLFSLWGLELFNNQQRLQDWYGLTPAQHTRGMDALRTWVRPPACNAGEAAQQCPETVNLLPRLWKGPLRVVWEELGASGEPPAQVCSRGMVYGRTNVLNGMWQGTEVGRGRRRRERPPQDSNIWKVHMYHWGNQSQTENLFYPAAQAPSQRNDLPITAAWACVSSVVWLAYFMLDQRADYSDGSGMADRGLSRDDSPASDYIDFVFRGDGARGTRRRLQVRGGSDPALLLYSGEGATPEFTLTDDIAIMGHDIRGTTVGHNVAYLKVKSPGMRVAEGQTLDSKGFVSAYNPMSGDDLGVDGNGRYLKLNASGPCSRDSSDSTYMRTHRPRLDDGTRGERVTEEASHRRQHCNSHFTKLNIEPSLELINYLCRFNAEASGGKQGIGDAQQGLPLPPIMISPMSGGATRQLHADRAVPFPTMRECEHNMSLPTFNYGRGRHHTLSAIQSGSSIELDGQKRIRSRSEQLLPGDVVEFPLATWLDVCGVSGFSGRQFDPQGSFLLGNSITPRDASPALHDNLVAMRTQLYVDLALGAFYCDEDVGQGRGAYGRGANRHEAIPGWSRSWQRTEAEEDQAEEDQAEE